MPNQTRHRGRCICGPTGGPGGYICCRFTSPISGPPPEMSDMPLRGGCGCRSGAAIGAAAVYMCGGGGCIDCCTGYGPGVVALCTPYMFGSSWLLGAGETPEKLFGEFQLLVVAGEVAGESSLLRLRLAFESGCGAAMGSMPTGFFFRCARCFSSMASRPSFVKGFGNTSFMPGSGLLVEAADTITQRAGVAYRVENTLRYRRFECLKSWL